MKQLEEFLQQCRDIEAKATKGPWKFRYVPQYDQTLRCIDNHDTSIVCDAGSLVKPNGIFIAFSRNNFLKLVECVKVLSGACCEIKLHYAHPLHDHNWAFKTEAIAITALEKAEKLFKCE